MDLVTLALAKIYANKVAAGFSSVRVEGTSVIFTLNDGVTEATVTVPTPADGVSITSVEIDENNHLICTLSDHSTIDAGEVPQGPAGRGIVSIRKTKTVGLVDTYTIFYTDNTTSTFTVTNGSGGGSADPQVYIGEETPSDEDILVWIDTSTYQLITADNQEFVTADNEIFVLAD